MLIQRNKLFHLIWAILRQNLLNQNTFSLIQLIIWCLWLLKQDLLILHLLWTAFTIFDPIFEVNLHKFFVRYHFLFNASLKYFQPSQGPLKPLPIKHTPNSVLYLISAFILIQCLSFQAYSLLHGCQCSLEAIFGIKILLFPHPLIHLPLLLHTPISLNPCGRLIKLVIAIDFVILSNGATGWALSQNSLPFCNLTLYMCLFLPELEQEFLLPR